MGTKNSRIGAFTLIELLVIVAIIALLIILAINVFVRQIAKGNDSKRKGDFNRIKIALEEYEKDHNCYPPIPPDTVNLMTCNPGTGLAPYLVKIPCDPTTHLSYYYEPDPGNCPAWFRIYTKLENAADTAILGTIGPSGLYNYYVGSANAPAPIIISGGGTSTPPPEGGATTGYWGCINGSCVPVDVSSPGHPVCNPTYTDSNCGITKNCTESVFPCTPI